MLMPMPVAWSVCQCQCQCQCFAGGGGGKNLVSLCLSAAATVELLRLKLTGRRGGHRVADQWHTFLFFLDMFFDEHLHVVASSRTVPAPCCSRAESNESGYS